MIHVLADTYPNWRDYRRATRWGFAQSHGDIRPTHCPVCLDSRTVWEPTEDGCELMPVLCETCLPGCGPRGTGSA